MGCSSGSSNGCSNSSSGSSNSSSGCSNSSSGSSNSSSGCSNSSSGGVKAGKGEDQTCEHPHRFWSSIRIILGELTTQFMCNHSFVQVLFKCAYCQKEFHVTYDLLADNDGEKRKRSQHYVSNDCKVLSSSNVARNFDFVDERYFEMWEKYNLVSKNCKDWAREFYNKLI